MKSQVWQFIYLENIGCDGADATKSDAQAIFSRTIMILPFFLNFLFILLEEKISFYRTRWNGCRVRGLFVTGYSSFEQCAAFNWHEY